MQVDGGAHQLGHVDLADNALLQNDLLLFYIVGSELLLLLVGENHGLAAQLDNVLAIDLNQLGVEQVHLGRADEAGNKQAIGMVKDFLRSGVLLDKAVPS